MSLVRVAVIGTGHLGKIHARLAKQLTGAELAAIVECHAPARAAVAAEVQVPAYADFHDCLDAFDAAIVATPTRFHYEVVAELLARGKHVFVEKPITLNSADADELVALAERNDRVLQVGHVERFNPAFEAVRAQLGRPLFIDAVRCGPFSGRSTDIGVVLDLMIHDLDVALSLQPGELRSVDAIGVPVLGHNEDLAQAWLRFEGGCIAQFQASRVSTVAQRMMRIFFETGFASIDFGAKTVDLVRPSVPVLTGHVNVDAMTHEQRTHVKENLFTNYLPKVSVTVTDHNAIAKEHENFVAAICGTESVRVSGRDGRNAVDAAERILASIAAHSWGTFPAGWRQDSAHAPIPRPHFLRTPVPSGLRRAG
jgi:predicted dehydrogenase